MSLRTATLRLAATFPKGSEMRSELLWQVIAAELVDVDKFGGNESYRRSEAVKAIAIMVRDGKKPVWVVDVGGALKDYRDFHKELVEDVSGYFLEAAAYASEAQEHEEEGTLMSLYEKWGRTRFKIQPIVSPRTKKPGYKITWSS
jgi:hypothetical protein